MSEKRLGRGLEALFSTENLDVNAINELEQNYTKDEVIEIKLKDLRPNPYQPRKVFDEDALEELAESIKLHGVFQPIIVKESIKGFEIVAGERRFRASKIAGLETIPAVVRDFSDQLMMEIGLLENLQREDLTAIEEAKAYSAMLDKLKITQQELSKRVGKSRSHITNILGLLKLPELVQEFVMEGKIDMGHARVLSKLKDEEQVKNLAEQIIEEGLSVRQVEEIAKGIDRVAPQKQVKPPKSQEYVYVEGLIRDKYKAKVKVDEKKIVINFSDVEELNRILELMGVIED